MIRAGGGGRSAFGAVSGLAHAVDGCGVDVHHVGVVDDHLTRLQAHLCHSRHHQLHLLGDLLRRANHVFVTCGVPEPTPNCSSGAEG